MRLLCNKNKLVNSISDYTDANSRSSSKDTAIHVLLINFYVSHIANMLAIYCCLTTFKTQDHGFLFFQSSTKNIEESSNDVKYTLSLPIFRASCHIS